MKPNIFIEGPQVGKFVDACNPNDEVIGKSLPYANRATDFWYIDLGAGKDAVFGFTFNVTTNVLTEIRLPEIIEMFKI